MFGFAGALNRPWCDVLSDMGSLAMEVVMCVCYKSHELHNKVCVRTALFGFLTQHHMLLFLAPLSKSGAL